MALRTVVDIGPMSQYTRLSIFQRRLKISISFSLSSRFLHFFYIVIIENIFQQKRKFPIECERGFVFPSLFHELFHEEQKNRWKSKKGAKEIRINKIFLLRRSSHIQISS